MRELTRSPRQPITTRILRLLSALSTLPTNPNRLAAPAYRPGVSPLGLRD
jgi:hypothetical protein